MGDRDGASLPWGLVSLGDWLPDAASGVRMGEPERFRQLVDLGVLADQLGAASFHLGEHHFSEYSLSSPTPVLAAVAERTRHVRLSTAATLLPHHDPVRVAEDYATVDVLSGGRVELLGGRGVYHEHYAQFGQDYADSESLMLEAVDALRLLWTQEGVSWSGRLRPPLTNVTVRPRPVQRPHPTIWLSASSEASARRAVAAGCPIVIPTVSTGTQLPVAIAAAFRSGWAEAGLPTSEGMVSLHVHLHVGAGTTAEAVEAWRPYQHGYLRWVLAEIRGYTGPLPPHFDELGTPIAQAVCGGVDDVVADLTRRIVAMGGTDRLLVQCDSGGLPPAEVEAVVRRFAAEVLPRLDAQLAAAGLPGGRSAVASR